ncbi:YeeE/YedE family protein [Nitrosospira lacus]|uniref:YeeE/YedE family protein n=1 Tax=Nitrosospira lacus TaxID=1288494 RepID=UPI0002C54089|nr:YeeE/YedE family protein [Nitrosospira lacus]
MINITAWVSGLIFGLGLILAGMANPGKVLAFLDVAGAWDPSLALVMAGAIGVGSVAFAMAGKRDRSYLGFPINLPTSRVIDKRLVLGSLAFGMGWGMAGICPGPALVLVGSGSVKGMVFVAAMLLGMGIFEILERHRFIGFFGMRNPHNDIASTVSGRPPSHDEAGYVKK